MFRRLLSSEKNCPACLTNTRANGIKKKAGTTTLAYRIVINSTIAKSVLKLVSTFRLAWSSPRQETDIDAIQIHILLSVANILHLFFYSRHTGVQYFD